MRTPEAAMFAQSEFKEWAEKNKLEPTESYVFDRHLRGLNPSESRVLDVGTGAGRFLFSLAQLGFKNLVVIDVCEELLQVARQRSRQKNVPIEFHAMDASSLQFQDAAFDLAIAMQQVICFIPDDESRMRALSEFSRVLKPGGTLLLSVLPYEGRWYNRAISLAALPLKLMRQERKKLSASYLPWLRNGGKPNLNYLFSRQPYTYWFRTQALYSQLENVGFEILEVKSSRMILENKETFQHGGSLYLVARKRATH